MLNVLRDDLVWGNWAEQYLRRLAVDPDLVGDEEIQRLRKSMIAEDDLHLTSRLNAQGMITVDPQIMLLDLLKRNSENRMAFEYLMAIRLCNDDVPGAIALFPFLDDLSYREIPALYEEAALIYLHTHLEEARVVGSAVFFRGRKISQRTMEEFNRLRQIGRSNGGLNEKAEAAVASELGKTYFYYFSYTSRKRS